MLTRFVAPPLQIEPAYAESARIGERKALSLASLLLRFDSVPFHWALNRAAWFCGGLISYHRQHLMSTLFSLPFSCFFRAASQRAQTIYQNLSLLSTPFSQNIHKKSYKKTEPYFIMSSVFKLYDFNDLQASRADTSIL